MVFVGRSDWGRAYGSKDVKGPRVMGPIARRDPPGTPKNPQKWPKNPIFGVFDPIDRLFWKNLLGPLSAIYFWHTSWR